MAAVFDAAKAAPHMSGVDVVSTSSAAQSPADNRCGECEQCVATWECLDCGEIYCDDCRAMVHSKGRRKRHSKFNPIVVCANCQVSAAKLECLECDLSLCGVCCTVVHAVSTHASHKHIKAISSGGAKGQDCRVTNGFMINVNDLKLARFEGEPHVASTSVFTSEIAAWCRAKGRLFHDPEPSTLALAVRPEVSGLSISVKLPPETLKKLREAADALHRRNVKKEMELVEALDSVQLWRRLSKYMPQPTLFAEGNVLLKAKPLGAHVASHAVHTLPKFERGVFDDTWFRLALSMVALNRITLSNLFVSAENSDVGMLTLQFYRGASGADGGPEGWQCITIDDLVPFAPAHVRTDGRIEYLNSEGGVLGYPAEYDPAADSTTSGADESRHVREDTMSSYVPPALTKLIPAFGLTDQKDELWAIMLEKGFAKFLGSYTMLHKGDTVDALNSLTAGKCRVVHWDPKAMTEEALGMLWWTVKTATQLGLLQSCTECTANPAQGNAGFVERDEGDYLEWQAGEAVISTVQLTPQELNEMQANTTRGQNGASLILLRNTHGTTEWTGDWSATSPLWKTAVRDYVNYKTMDEFMFWMSAQDFAKRYNTYLMCTEFVGGPLAFYKTLPPCAAGAMRLHAEQFYITVEDLDDDEIPIHFCLAQPDKGQLSHQSFTSGARCMSGLEVNLFRVPCMRMVEPVEVSHGAPREEDRWDSAAVAAEGPSTYRWPEEGVPLKVVEGSEGFTLRLAAGLEPGHYVLTVGQAEMDCRDAVTMFVSMHDMQSEGGRFACPFPLNVPSQRQAQQQQQHHHAFDKSLNSPMGGKRPTPASMNNRNFTMRSLGTAKDPQVAIPKTRPKTPRDTVMQRIETAKVSAEV